MGTVLTHQEAVSDKHSIKRSRIITKIPKHKKQTQGLPAASPPSYSPRPGGFWGFTARTHQLRGASTRQLSAPGTFLLICKGPSQRPVSPPPASKTLPQARTLWNRKKLLTKPPPAKAHHTGAQALAGQEQQVVLKTEDLPGRKELCTPGWALPPAGHLTLAKSPSL